MRCLFKLPSLYSNPHFQVSKFQNFHLSLHSKSSKPHSSKKAQEINIQNNKETHQLSSLFDEITAILGTQNLILDKSSEFIISKTETHLRKSELTKESSSCTQPVCKNANTSIKQEDENLSGSEDTLLRSLTETDVSPIVQKVTEIVRGENGGVSMEERLESAGFEFDLQVVDKVLKRCFKVPHLASRFFNWVKLRNGFSHTTQTYNTMIYIAGEAKEFELVEELMEEMGKNSCEKNIKTWTILVSHYGKAKLIGKALLVFEKMKKSGIEPDVVIYKQMLHSLCNAGKAEIALEFYKEMVYKEMGLDMSLYKLLMKCLALSGDTTSVHLVADDMMRIYEFPEEQVYACVLKSFCISGRIREALELIRDMKIKNITLDQENFETLVKGLCRADKIGDALEIVEIMKKQNVLDGNIYGIILSAYLRRKDVSKAFEAFQSIKESGYIPTILTYTELMQQLIRLKEFQKASELFREMLENGLELDSVAITAMIACHVRHNQTSEVWDLFNSMEERGIKATRKCYIVFIKELCKISKTDEIIKVLSKMQASKLIIGDDLFQLILSYLEKNREMKKLEMVKEMQQACRLNPHGIKASTSDDNDIFWREALNMELKFNQLEEKRLNSHLMGPLPDSFNKHDLQEICGILSSSIDWCLKQQALEKSTVGFTPELVVEILHNNTLFGCTALQFFSWVGKVASYRHTTETYNMAIKISGNGKDFKHMRSLFLEMDRKGSLINADTWTIMIMQYGRTGLTEIALRFFRDMKASGCNPTGSTYKFLIISLCGKKGRKVDEAIKTFEEMIRGGFVPDKELVESYLSCLCEVGKLLDGKKCVESLCKVGFTISLSYSLYIRALCRSGRLEEALALVNEVDQEKNTLNQYIYGSLVHGLLQKGRLEEALAKIESMKQIGINPTVHVYTSLIVYFFKEKDIGKALESFEKMKQEGCEPTIVTYSALIRGYMTMEKVIDAWSIFHYMKQRGPLPDFKTYSMFISCLCRAGKSEEALQVISEMVDSGTVPSTVNFRTVFYGLNREGKQDLARIVLQKKLDLKSKRKFST